jgi:ABC-type multidrug transport system fused ATPase/permease subunit
MLGILGQPYAFSMVVNALQRNDPDLISTILKWLMIYFLCFCVFEICHRSARFLERYTAFRNKRRFICSIYNHLQRLPLEWHTENHTGNVIDRVNRAADALYRFSESQSTYINVIMSFIIPLVVLFSLSFFIIIVAISAGIILVVVTRKLYAKSVPEYRAYNKGFNKVAAALYDYIGNITTIIILRLGKAVEKDSEDRINDIFPHIAKEHKITQLKCFVNALITVLLNVGLIFYYIIISRKHGNVIMIGSITMLFSYLVFCLIHSA